MYFEKKKYDLALLDLDKEIELKPTGEAYYCACH